MACHDSRGWPAPEQTTTDHGANTKSSQTKPVQLDTILTAIAMGTFVGGPAINSAAKEDTDREKGEQAQLQA